MPQIEFTINAQQGPLPGGFQINLEGRYITLVGANNTAKTSLLTAIFKQYYQEYAEQSRSKICFILPERIYVDVSSQPQGYTIEQYNQQLATTIGSSNKNYHSWDNNLPVSVLPKVLLNHTDFYEQLGRLNTFFFHVYPVSGGIVILTDEANKQAEASDQPQKTPPPMLPLMVVILCSLFLITGIVFVPNTPPTQQITQIASLTIPGDIPARIIPPLTETLSQTAPATGRGHSDATYAHGTITFYNGAFTPQIIPQNMLFTTESGIQIVTDQAVTIPAGSPPKYGETTAVAHALTAGIQGNIPASAINTICCAEAVKAINPRPFTGGRDARDYHLQRYAEILSH